MSTPGQPLSSSEGEVTARHKKRSSAQGRATLPLTLEKLKELQAAASHPKKKVRLALLFIVEGGRLLTIPLLG
jgi:hypothetical protein